MLFRQGALLLLSTAAHVICGNALQMPFRESVASESKPNASFELFKDLEEYSRIVDIAYCVGTAGLGIYKPFLCASRCEDFKSFELVTTWNTGALLSDSCGYIALSHPPSKPRIIVAFRGTYSLANTIIDLSTIPQEYVPYPDDEDKGWWPEESTEAISTSSKCENCTVHAGFMASWRHTRHQIVSQLKNVVEQYPHYQLALVGHSLGGAVATLASLDFHAKGWNPQVTTFGEPRIGNKALMRYIDEAFPAGNETTSGDMFRRVTHVDDPIPLLPLSEWGFSTHAGEIYIDKPDLPPEVRNLRRCDGDHDLKCIAGGEKSSDSLMSKLKLGADIEAFKHWRLRSKDFWEVPARFRIWQLFFAHRDYFWRLGLCLPRGNPEDWYHQHPLMDIEDSE